MRISTEHDELFRLSRRSGCSGLPHGATASASTTPTRSFACHPAHWAQEQTPRHPRRLAGAVPLGRGGRPSDLPRRIAQAVARRPFHSNSMDQLHQSRTSTRARAVWQRSNPDSRLRYLAPYWQRQMIVSIVGCRSWYWVFWCGRLTLIIGTRTAYCLSVCFVCTLPISHPIYGPRRR
jgi:hypothetical protein